MGFLYQIFDHAFFESGDMDGECDFKSEAFTVIAGANADLAGHGGVAGHVDLGFARHKLERSQEAGGVTGGKKLLRVGAGASATAEFLGSGKGDGKDAVCGAGFAFAASVEVAWVV